MIEQIRVLSTYFEIILKRTPMFCCQSSLYKKFWLREFRCYPTGIEFTGRILEAVTEGNDEKVFRPIRILWDI